jgi:hypothetical protein
MPITVDSIHLVTGVGAGVGAAEAPITISKTITDITLPRIAIYRIEQNQTIPTIIDNIGYPAYRFTCLVVGTPL